LEKAVPSSTSFSSILSSSVLSVPVCLGLYGCYLKSKSSLANTSEPIILDDSGLYFFGGALKPFTWFVYGGTGGPVALL